MKVTLAAARVNAELKQEDVAKALSVAKSTVINWEKYNVDPSIRQAYALASLYHCTIDDIIFFKQ